MKLILSTGNEPDRGTVDLPNDLLWSDEFTWQQAVQSHTYTLSGALIIESGLHLAGRPITLTPPSDMAWVSRTVLLQLRAWVALINRTFTLTFEYPTDTRSFNVVFDQTGSAITATPVKQFPQHEGTDWFSVGLKFIEV